MSGDVQEPAPRNIGRYLLFREIGHGGMATVHLGRLHGPAGFARTVAIKRLHAQYSRDPEFVSMFLDEARLAARIQHPNVVSVLDVVASDGELFLIMDYVHGESLFKLFKSAAATKTPIPRRIFVSIITNVLYGLDAAHDARSDLGTPLDIVHRDVSPQNVLLGIDGVARLLDFGVAKASQRVHWSTQDGQIKGKLSYMAPEQVSTGIVDRRADVYAVGVMLWEGLTGQRLFKPEDVGQLVGRILEGKIKPPSTVAASTPKVIDEITMRALARSAADRYPTAHEMATALERAIAPATPRQIGQWVTQVASAELRERADTLAQIEGRAAPTAHPSDFRLAVAIPNVASSRPDAGTRSRLPSLVNDELTPTKEAPKDAEISVEIEGPVSTKSAESSATEVEPPTKEEREISEVSASELLPISAEAASIPKESPGSSGPTPATSKAPENKIDDGPIALPGVNRQRKVVGAVGASVVVVACVLLGYRSCAHESSAKQTSVAISSTTAAHTITSSVPPIPPSASLDSSTIASSATPTVPSANARPQAVAVSKASVPATHPTSSSRRTTGKNKLDCDPPYTIDSSGVRVPKRQCF